ncbi:DivIVA domain-containing protein [Mycoplasma buteonis]|uniref:DivIVA domain-containing protein n=1 Tax=Mycoplasma buteonis TaxID=171280 RepID=UPI000560DB89|nr:DivIVA domain-containing protein [Mycoplasma buteonis]
MNDLIKNLKEEIVRRNFKVSLNGYSKADVDIFLEHIATRLHYLSQDINLLESDLDKKEKMIVDQKNRIDELTFEVNRLEKQIKKLEESNKGN